MLAACGVQTSATTQAPSTSGAASDGPAADVENKVYADELGDDANTFTEIANFNNFYEFSTDKTAVARLASDFQTSPWTVEVGGLVNNPKTYDMDDILKKFTQEERIYRLRCVEAWSMVIPWTGFEASGIAG